MTTTIPLPAIEDAVTKQAVAYQKAVNAQRDLAAKVWELQLTLEVDRLNLGVKPRGFVRQYWLIMSLQHRLRQARKAELAARSVLEAAHWALADAKVDREVC